MSFFYHKYVLRLLYDAILLLQASSSPGYHPVQPPTSQGPVPAPMASIPGPKMPQVVAPTPTPGFRPITNSVAQRPGIVSMQPPSPQAAAAQPVVTPSAPPPTVQVVDTSNVPGKP